MQLNLTEEEYRYLLEFIHLAHWVMYSHDENPIKKDDPYHALRKKIYSHCKEMGAEDLVEYVSELDDYFELMSFEESLHKKFITPYEEEFFWDELIERLAVRDLIDELGIKKINSISGLDRIAKIEEKRQRYEEEFDKVGLKRLKLENIGTKATKTS